MNFYNGFTAAEREAKLKAQHERERQGFPHHPPGPCSICGDANVKLEPHDEDYGKPYLWEPPAQYAVCHRCHARLHARFTSPEVWEAHKEHVRRGGVASDDKRFSAVRAAIRSGDLSRLAPRLTTLTGNEWWERLSTDPSTLTDPAARPRP